MHRHRVPGPTLQKLFIVTIASFVVGFPAIANAAQLPQTNERARALYEAGVKEFDARGPARACPMFEEATSLAPESWGSWMMLGECRQREGRMASAHRAYATAAEVATKLGHVAHAQQATRKAVAIEPQVAKLVLELSNDVRSASELEVLVDDKPVTISGATTTLPLDRGEHKVLVKAKGKAPMERNRSLLMDGAQATVHFDQWSGPGTKENEAAFSVTYRKKSSFFAPVPKWQQKAAWITGSVGAASLVAGSIAGIAAISRKNASNNGPCVGNECTHEGLALRQGSLLAGNVSTGFFVAGGILATATVTLALVPLKRKQTVGLVVAPTQIGLHATF